jgi:hypothetical protein
MLAARQQIKSSGGFRHQKNAMSACRGRVRSVVKVSASGPAEGTNGCAPDAAPAALGRRAALAAAAAGGLILSAGR